VNANDHDSLLGRQECSLLGHRHYFAFLAPFFFPFYPEANDQAHLPAVQLPINSPDSYQPESTTIFADELRVK